MIFIGHKFFQPAAAFLGKGFWEPLETFGEMITPTRKIGTGSADREAPAEDPGSRIYPPAGPHANSASKK